MKVIAVEDKATASWDLEFTAKSREDWVKLRGLVAIIKASIPASDRTYNEDTKHWSILSKYYENLKSAGSVMNLKWEEQQKIKAGKFFYEEVLNTPVVVTREMLQAQLCKLMEVQPDTLHDTVLAKKAFRAAALRYHPDRNNGDGSKMSELNSLWSQYNA